MQQENIPIKVGLLEQLYGSQGTRFVISAYQRNYTWVANREVKQLLEDIKVVLSGERNKHFIGIGRPCPIRAGANYYQRSAF